MGEAMQATDTRPYKTFLTVGKGSVYTSEAIDGHRLYDWFCFVLFCFVFFHFKIGSYALGVHPASREIKKAVEWFDRGGMIMYCIPRAQSSSFVCSSLFTLSAL